MALFEIFVFDVLLASVHLYSDICLAYTYFDTDNPWWAGVTLFAIALPGILGNRKKHFIASPSPPDWGPGLDKISILFQFSLEFLTFLLLYCAGELKGKKSEQIQQLLIWGVLFGPVFFPLSLIIWHIYQIWNGETAFMEFQNIARFINRILCLFFERDCKTSSADQPGDPDQVRVSADPADQHHDGDLAPGGHTDRPPRLQDHQHHLLRHDARQVSHHQPLLCQQRQKRRG